MGSGAVAVYEAARGAVRRVVGPPRSTRLKARLAPIAAPFLRRDLTALARLYSTDKDWRHSFTSLYQLHLSSLRTEPITLLEIGILSGGSLRMWGTYFRRARVYGIDIVPKVVVHPRVTVLTGSQSDPSFLSAVGADLGTIDVVIDDGSHVNSDVIGTFDVLFPRVAPGGFYVIEDVQTAYWDDYGGAAPGADGESTSIGMVKRLVDGVNHRHFRLPAYEPTYTDRNIAAIHVYDNIVFIEKSQSATAG